MSAIYTKKRGDLVPEGEYEVEVTGAYIVDAPREWFMEGVTPTEFLNVRLVVVSGPHEGTVVRSSTSMNLHHAFRRLFRELLHGLAFEDEQMKTEDIEYDVVECRHPRSDRVTSVEYRVTKPGLIGRRAVAVVYHHKPSGRDRVKTLRRLPG